MESQNLETSAYICCDFIGDYAAIVEQLWIKGDVLKKNRRKGIPPIVLEVIICLKDNAHLWNKMDMVLDYKTAREYKSTITKEKASEDENEYRVEEYQESSIEY